MYQKTVLRQGFPKNSVVWDSKKYLVKTSETDDLARIWITISDCAIILLSPLAGWECRNRFSSYNGMARYESSLSIASNTAILVSELIQPPSIYWISPMLFVFKDLNNRCVCLCIFISQSYIYWISPVLFVFKDQNNRCVCLCIFI